MMLWYEKVGFAIMARLVQPAHLAPLLEEAERLLDAHCRRAAGVRRVLERSKLFTKFTQSELIRTVIAPVLGHRAFPVRSILFDKSPTANWDVSWHQDTTIAVQARENLEGFGPWSLKDGVAHVRPPAAVLEGMLSLRVNLDACGLANGPLLVAPGTHRNGIRLDPPDTRRMEAACVAAVTEAGGAVWMRPLLFHASRKALHPTHRRVLHIEFAAAELPPPLRWAQDA
jgi:ectoine hydroxylase-related dioxygenase (phytanoyl-CoA dioxygenase family)